MKDTTRGAPNALSNGTIETWSHGQVPQHLPGPQFVSPYSPQGHRVMHPAVVARPVVVPQYVIQPVYRSPAPLNGSGTAGLGFGVVGVFFAWVPFFGFLLGLLAFVFGTVGVSQWTRQEATNPVVSGFGVILGLAAMLFWPLVIVMASATTA